jgi:hypothetical protein
MMVVLMGKPSRRVPKELTLVICVCSIGPDEQQALAKQGTPRVLIQHQGLSLPGSYHPEEDFQVEVLVNFASEQVQEIGFSFHDHVGLYLSRKKGVIASRSEAVVRD